MRVARSVLVVGKNAEIHKFAGWHSGLHTHTHEISHTHTQDITHTHTQREAEGGAQMSLRERRSPLPNSCGPLVGTLFFLSVCNSTTVRSTYN
jgi:hypothetical protein